MSQGHLVSHKSDIGWAKIKTGPLRGLRDKIKLLSYSMEQSPS